MLRNIDKFDVLSGNTPAMLRVSEAGFAKFLKAIPFVSAVGTFKEYGHEKENCDNCIIMDWQI